MRCNQLLLQCSRARARPVGCLLVSYRWVVVLSASIHFYPCSRDVRSYAMPPWQNTAAAVSVCVLQRPRSGVEWDKIYVRLERTICDNCVLVLRLVNHLCVILNELNWTSPNAFRCVSFFFSASIHASRNLFLLLLLWKTLSAIGARTLTKARRYRVDRRNINWWSLIRQALLSPNRPDKWFVVDAGDANRGISTFNSVRNVRRTNRSSHAPENVVWLTSETRRICVMKHSSHIHDIIACR